MCLHVPESLTFNFILLSTLLQSHTLIYYYSQKSQRTHLLEVPTCAYKIAYIKLLKKG